MIVRSVTLNNYRLYRGENRIEFGMDGGRNIFLVSGENGFGKTTFLHSLIWCLYGRMAYDIEEDTRKDILSGGYGSFLQGNLNNSARDEFDRIGGDTLAEIRRRGYSPATERLMAFTRYSVGIDFAGVEIPSLACSSVNVVRSYDLALGKEAVEILIDGEANGLADGIGHEIFINDFILNKDIARFFFFDSERVVAMAETGTAAERKRLASAYNVVLGVRKYEDLKRNLENVRLRLRKRSTDLASRERLLGQIRERERLEKAMEENARLAQALEGEMRDLRLECDELQLQLVREGGGQAAMETGRLEQSIEAARARDAEYKARLRQFLEYAPLAIAGRLLRDTREQLERDMREQRSLIDRQGREAIVLGITGEMLRALDEVPGLGAEAGGYLRARIRDIASRYRERDAGGKVPVVLDEADHDEFMAVYGNVTTTYRAEFVRLKEDYRKNRQRLDRDTKRLAGIRAKEGDEVIRELRERNGAIEAEIGAREAAILQAREQRGAMGQRLATASRLVSELGRKVGLEGDDTPKDRLAESLVAELSTFLDALKRERKASLEGRIRDTLNSLMHKKDYIGRVEVVMGGDDDMDVRLHSTDGRPVPRESLSKGEQQLLATAMLKAMVDESGLEFPVFIDSPLQKFDKDHAERIITEFYPNVSRQVILFPLPHKELTIDEYEAMKPMVSATYRIVNDTRSSRFERIPVNDFMR